MIKIRAAEWDIDRPDQDRWACISPSDQGFLDQLKVAPIRLNVDHSRTGRSRVVSMEK